MSDLLAVIRGVAELADKSPVALRAVRLFTERLLRGDNVQTALTKTAEILAAQALVG